MKRTRRRTDRASLEAEIEEARPFLSLAREIRAQVDRVGANGRGGEELVEALESIPTRERQAVARAVFDRLPAGEQWEIIERAFGDAEIRSYLEARRQERLDEVRRSSARRALAAEARAAHALDTATLPPHEQLVLGLFAESDVRAAIPRGHTSTACARRVVLLARAEKGMFQVIDDVFNPAGGYFVTPGYDQETWRHDRLPAHAVVRLGFMAPTNFEPVLYIGGRVDFELGGAPREGLLHLGYVMVGDEDVFARGGETT